MESKSPQQVFNQIKGAIKEINVNDHAWSSLVLEVGHHNKRTVNLVAKTKMLEPLVKEKGLKPKDIVVCRFYVSSRKANNDRYYTNANLLAVDKLSSHFFK